MVQKPRAESRKRETVGRLSALRLPPYPAKECPVDCREITPFSRSEIARIRQFPFGGRQWQGGLQRPCASGKGQWQRRRRSSRRRWSSVQSPPGYRRIDGGQAARYFRQRILREKSAPARLRQSAKGAADDGEGSRR